jgi:hypothetical protein
MSLITEKDYKKHPLSYWKGRKVKVMDPLENGIITIPVGTILEIVDKFDGFELRGLEVCPHCKIGRKLSISRVRPRNCKLRLLPEAETLKGGPDA